MLLRSFDRFHALNKSISSMERASVVFQIIQGWGNYPFREFTEEERTLVINELLLKGVREYDIDHDALSRHLRQTAESMRGDDGFSSLAFRSFDASVTKDSETSLIDLLDDSSTLSTRSLRTSSQQSGAMVSSEEQIWRNLVSEEEDVLDDFVNNRDDKMIFEHAILNNAKDFLTLMESDFSSLLAKSETKVISNAEIHRYFKDKDFLLVIGELNRRNFKFELVMRHYYNTYKDTLRRLAKLSKKVELNKPIIPFSDKNFALKDGSIIVTNKRLRFVAVNSQEFLDDFYDIVFSDLPYIKNRLKVDVEGTTYYRLLDDTMVGNPRVSLENLALLHFRNMVKQQIGEGAEYVGTIDELDLFLLNKVGLKAPKEIEFEFGGVKVTQPVDRVALS